MTKQLRKKIMLRSKLRNEFNKSRTSESWKKYKQQRNKCLSILKGTKTNYFNNLNPKIITNNKKVWSAVKPLFSNKSKAMNTIVLHETGKMIKNYKRVSEALNRYFTNLTKSLKLKKCISRKSFLKTPVKKTNQIYPKAETFSFHEIRETKTLEIIEKLPKNTATVFKDIPMRIIKDAAHVYSHRLTIIFNNCIKNSKFPDILKYADFTPVFKKADTTDKSNYRPISTLSNVSKIFVKLIYSQVNSYMEPKLSKYLEGFLRNRNTQHALLRMIESWRDKDQKLGAIIMDLSKQFDTLNHKLLFKKLEADGFDKKSLSFIESYFANKKQRTKIGDSFSKYQRIITQVTQGSILGLLFYNIFINDLFLSIDKSTFCNYTDDNTLYTSGNDAKLCH